MGAVEIVSVDTLGWACPVEGVVGSGGAWRDDWQCVGVEDQVGTFVAALVGVGVYCRRLGRSLASSAVLRPLVRLVVVSFVRCRLSSSFPLRLLFSFVLVPAPLSSLLPQRLPLSSAYLLPLALSLLLLFSCSLPLRVSFVALLPLFFPLPPFLLFLVPHATLAVVQLPLSAVVPFLVVFRASSASSYRLASSCLLPSSIFLLPHVFSPFPPPVSSSFLFFSCF